MKPRRNSRSISATRPSASPRSFAFSFGTARSSTPMVMPAAVA
jgi:hypothetical protein